MQQTETTVWMDIHPNSREFIKKYLMQYPERPMVRLQQGQVVQTEWEGAWWYTKVEEVDASLVKLKFHVNNRQESIYRGSTRSGSHLYFLTVFGVNFGWFVNRKWFAIKTQTLLI